MELIADTAQHLRLRIVSGLTGDIERVHLHSLDDFLHTWTLEPEMKVWVTKYALTKGIEEKEVKVSESSPSMVSVGWFETYHGEGKDWHHTRESAVARAENMRQDRLKSLRKSILELEAKRFT